MDIDEQIFKNADLLMVIPEINMAQLRDWQQRGCLSLASPGTGRTRFYSFRDAMVIDFLRIIVFHGERADTASRVAVTCADFIGDWIAAGGKLEYYEHDEYIMFFSAHMQKVVKASEIDENGYGIYYKVLKFHYCAHQLYMAFNDAGWVI